MSKRDPNLNKNTGNMDGARFYRFILLASLILGTLLITSLGLTSGNLVFGLCIPVLVIAIWFLNYPSWLFVVVVLAYYLFLKIPGIPTFMSVSKMARMMFIGVILATYIIKKQSKFSWTVADYCLAGFLGVILLTILVRGFGMRITGSESWGASKYAGIFVWCGFYYAVRGFQVRLVHIKWILWGTLGAGALVFLAQIAYVKSGGAAFWLDKFTEVKTKNLVGAFSAFSDQMVRYKMIRWLGFALMPFAFLWPRKRILSLGIAGASMFIVAVSGFRSSIVILGLIWIITGFIISRRRSLFWVGVGCLAVLGWMGLLLIDDYLPEAALRAVSWLPYVGSGTIAEQAMGTVEWRLEIWRYCWQQVPDYLLIGKGMTYDVSSLAWLQSSFYGTPEFYFATHSYHSGPLSLLLDTGAFGFVTMTGFFIFSCRDGFKQLKRLDRDHKYYNYAVFLWVYYLVLVLTFYGFYGDLGGRLAWMIIIYATLTVLSNATFLRKESPDLVDTRDS